MNVHLNTDMGNFDALKFGGLESKPPLPQASKASTLQTSSPQAPTFNPLESSEPVADVPADALSRDDALGKLVNSVFNLPPPPMPTFAD